MSYDFEAAVISCLSYSISVVLEVSSSVRDLIWAALLAIVSTLATSFC